MYKASKIRAIYICPLLHTGLLYNEYLSTQYNLMTQQHLDLGSMAPGAVEVFIATLHQTVVSPSRPESLC